MAQAKAGDAFIRHEFDEAISVHQAIVEAERILAEAHPMSEAKTAIKRMLKDDERCLAQLKELGRTYGATGKAEEVAGAMQELSETVTKSAEEAPSEAYEAHAVLLTMLRKQQDSSSAMAKIASKVGDTKARTAATEMQKATKAEAEELSTLLAKLAVDIATEGGEKASSAGR
jgi:thioredoxin-like negative regulator of GroEL